MYEIYYSRKAQSTLTIFHQLLTRSINTRRAHYQPLVWRSTDIPQRKRLLIGNSGWCQDTTGVNQCGQQKSPFQQKTKSIFVRCSCKDCSVGRCSCRAIHLPSTGACLCGKNNCKRVYKELEDSDDNDDDDDDDDIKLKMTIKIIMIM